jgi:predicted Zn-dependent protease
VPEPSDPGTLAQLSERWNRDKTSRLFLQLAEELRRAGRSSEALAVLDDGLRHHPESVAGMVAAARCRLDLGGDREAAELLERALERDPAQPVANKLLAEARIRLGEAGPARERLAIYRLLNERDAEIPELEARISALERGVGSVTRSPAAPAAPIFDLRPPGAGPRSPFTELAPPSAAGASPFARLHDRPRAEARIRARFAAEGIFPVAATAAARVAAAPVALEAVEPWAGPTATLAEPVPVAVPESASPAPLEAPPPAPLFSLHSLGDEVEREAAREPAVEQPAASATLASLYLQQGHVEEAEAEYRAVLAARPGDRFARTGMERIARMRGEGGARAPRTAGLTQRKIAALRTWLESLRRERRSRG